MFIFLDFTSLKTHLEPECILLLIDYQTGKSKFIIYILILSVMKYSNLLKPVNRLSLCDEKPR